jgi:L-alanine-DL-glutamate epimerase-like enolase superfamily enzyme
MPFTIKKAGVDVGTRHALNLIEGANIGLTVADDAGNGLGHKTFDFKRGNRAGEGDLITYDCEIIKDGPTWLSDRPGLGVEINKDSASKYIMDGDTWWG